jgi:predicted phosphohydrolase
MAFDQSFRYLDSEDDRRLLLKDIRQVRRAVIEMTETVPEAQWYTARYHGWSLAAMLGHLQMMDNLNLLLIQLALVGMRVPVSMNLVNSLNNVTARIFQQRLTTATIRGIEKKERQLADFILRLPIDKFTVQVYYPPHTQVFNH